MKTAAAGLALAAGGLLAGHAMAQGVPIPGVTTVTVPTVTAPTVKVPTATVPYVAPTSPSTPVRSPAPPAPPPVAAPQQAPSAGALPSTGGTAVQGASAPSTSASGASSSGPVPARSGGAAPTGSSRSGSAAGGGKAPSGGTRLTSSRPWISLHGRGRHRFVILRFRLPGAARLTFLVTEVSPSCRIVGRFRIRGRAGLNRVRFPSQPGKLRLEPGTYRISVRARTGLRLPQVTVVVVSGGVPGADDLTARQAADVCATAGGRLPVPSLPQGSGPPAAAHGAKGLVSTKAAGKRMPSPSLGGVLGSSVAETARTLEPVLLGLLALAILLLGVASLPQVALPESRTGYLLARHRLEIAGLGAAAFLGVVVAFVFG